MVVTHDEEETDNQLKKKIRRISQVVSHLLPEVEVEGDFPAMFLADCNSHGCLKGCDNNMATDVIDWMV